MTTLDTIFISHRMAVSCSACRHSSVYNTERYAALPLVVVASKLVCHRCGKVGAAELRPAPRVEVEA